MSHPHRDHVELLPDLIANYEVKNVCDSGALNDICGYRAFIEAASAKPRAVYHSALFDFGTHPVPFSAQNCYGQSLPAEEISVTHGSRIDRNPISLGPGASMTFLYADGSKHTDFNENSLVLRLDFGQDRILLMGDSPGGSRAAPTTPPSSKSIEGVLLSCCLAELHADERHYKWSTP